MADVLRFWLDNGVDGFRVDASAVLIKDALLRDNPINVKATKETAPPQRLVPVFTDDRPEAMHCIEFLRSVIDEYEDKVLCGEVQGKTDRIGHFYHGSKPRFHLPLNFVLLEAEWDALSLQAAIDAYLNALPAGAWPDWVIGGHDKQRIASTRGYAQARLIALLCMTLKGTPIFFAGDEIGAKHVTIPEDRVRDPFEKHVGGYGLGRDPERAPMKWDRSKNGGFTEGEPWLPVGGDDHPDVESQKRDKRSILHFYRELISMRRREPALVGGEYVPMRCRNDILSFRRKLDQTEILVGLNVSAEPRKLVWERGGTLLLTTEMDRWSEVISGPTQLRPHEGIIIKLS
jgi:alpha-glucosidase